VTKLSFWSVVAVAIAPVLARIETRAGHGAGKPTAKLIEEAADMWAFLVKNLGMRMSLADTR
jgi:prolyl oligopeptidase